MENALLRCASQIIVLMKAFVSKIRRRAVAKMRRIVNRVDGWRGHASMGSAKPANVRRIIVYKKMQFAWMGFPMLGHVARTVESAESALDAMLV